MKIKKGQLLRIQHRRKGTFVAEALKDFDTETAHWFPVEVAEGGVSGISRNQGFIGKWLPGDEIPCRVSLVRIVEILSQG